MPLTVLDTGTTGVMPLPSREGRTVTGIRCPAVRACEDDKRDGLREAVGAVGQGNPVKAGGI